MRPAVATVRSRAPATASRGALLTEAADDDQAVVDADAEPEHRDDVDRVHGDVARELSPRRARPARRPCWRGRARPAARRRAVRRTRRRARRRRAAGRSSRPHQVLLGLRLDLVVDDVLVADQHPRCAGRFEPACDGVDGGVDVAPGRPSVTTTADAWPSAARSRRHRSGRRRGRTRRPAARRSASSPGGPPLRWRDRRRPARRRRRSRSSCPCSRPIAGAAARGQLVDAARRRGPTRSRRRRPCRWSARRTARARRDAHDERRAPRRRGCGGDDGWSRPSRCSMRSR